MTGYGWVALGKDDTVTDPKCGTSAITSTTQCAATTWSTTDSLCMSGSIPALPASPTSADYSNNWGIMLGINATDPEGGGLGQSFSSVTITVTGSPTSGLRAKVHKKGGPSDGYCAPYTSGAIPFTSFTTECWNTTSPGTAITAADVPNIDQIGIQVPSSQTAITVSNLCITGITFAK